MFSVPRSLRTRGRCVRRCSSTAGSPSAPATRGGASPVASEAVAMSVVQGLRRWRSDHVEAMARGRGTVSVQRDHQARSHPLPELATRVDTGTPASRAVGGPRHPDDGTESHEPTLDQGRQTEVHGGLGYAAVGRGPGGVARLRETTGRDRSVGLAGVPAVAELVSRVQGDDETVQRAGLGAGLLVPQDGRRSGRVGLAAQRESGQRRTRDRHGDRHRHRPEKPPHVWSALAIRSTAPAISSAASAWASSPRPNGSGMS